MKNKSFFWASYSDLMTSLFFVMLILFVTTVTMMYLQGKANQEELDQIHNLQEAVNRLPTEYFEPDTVNKRWTLKEEFTPHFASKDATIPSGDTAKVISVGESLKRVVDQLNEIKKSDEYKDVNVRYMVVIEGMASNIPYILNDELSYKRALAVYELWKNNGIDFENSDCEVQVAGSGVRGIRPYNKDYYKAVKNGYSNPADYYDLKQEEKNQCIIIQIIPKISTTKK